MSNPQFCFGYLSQQCAMIMSLDDAYYRKMFGSNDNFRHWTPGNSSTSSSTSSARQNYNTSSAHQNYGTTSPDHQNYNTSSARQKNNTSSAHQNYSTSSAHQNYSTTLPDHQFYGTSPVREKYNSTSRARPNFRPNVNNNNNDSATAFSKNRQSFGKVRSNSDKVMPGVRNGPKVQTNTYVKPSNYENRKQEVGDVYEKKPDVVFINGHSIQLAALPVISNGQSVYNPGYAAENHYRSSFAAKSPNNNNLVSPPITGCFTVGQNSFRPCSFCRQNGDRPEFYLSHQLKDSSGNVVCPVLSAYVCDICGATGSQAHTRTYCPVLKSTAQKPLKSAVCLKNTPRNSSGCIRKQFWKP